MIAPLLLTAALPFVADSLAPGVTLLRDPAGTNTLVVERADGLLLVDVQGTAEKGRELARAVAGVSTKPVRWIVLTQPHVESWGGLGAFPGAIVVASRGAREAFDDPKFDPAAEYLRRFPGATVPTERPRPTLILQSLSLLDDPLRPVELIPLPRAHSGGDVAVRIPAEGIVHVGDLVAPDRNPCAGPDSRVAGWNVQLNEIASGAPRIVVATRGAPFGDSGVRRQREAIAWVRNYTQQAFVDLVKVADIPARLRAMPAWREYFDADATPSCAGTVVDRAIEEAVEERRRRGLPVE